jgi:hypothetical protein
MPKYSLIRMKKLLFPVIKLGLGRIVKIHAIPKKMWINGRQLAGQAMITVGQ